MSTCSVSSSPGILDYIDENRFFSFLTTSTFIIIGTFLYIVSLYRYFERENISNIAQPFAPYGNIQDVIDKYTNLFELITKYYNKLKRKGCKYVGMYLFVKPCIVVLDTSLITEIIINHKKFVEVNRNEINVEQTVKLYSEDIDEYLKILNTPDSQSFIDHLKRSNGKLEIILHNFVCNLVYTVFGLEKTEVTTRLTAEAEKQVTSSSFKYYFNMVYPYFGKQSHQSWNKVIKDQILHRKKTDIRKPDILQNIIDSSITMQNNSTNLYDEYINKFVESIVFSYHTSLFCLYELSKNVDIQEELIGEIRRFNKSDKNICDLPYLMAVIKETLRKYPPVPIVLKKCEENYESQTGCKFKKGNFVLIPTYPIHNDAEIYLDPGNFDPDRFLEDDIEQFNTFLPFGSKYVMHCTEFQISIPIIKVIMLHIFSNFKIKLSDKNYNLNFDSTKLNIQPARAIPIQFESLP